MILFCLLYTIPLSLASNLLAPESLKRAFPNLDEITTVSGILTGWLYTLFFTVCPYLFKALANYGSGATSLRDAERKAIRYYWFFILITAFAGNSLATMFTRGIYSERGLGAEARETLRFIASTIPTQLSATWLNWIIVRMFVSFPALYLLQLNTFLFSAFGMKCCARLTRGG